MTDLPAPEHRYIQAGSLRLHYVDWGTPGLRPLMLLHELQDCARCWDFFAARARWDYHLLALDYRGHGESDRASAEAYTLQGYTSDVEALVDGAGLEQVTLVGHGAGGLSAIMYAVAHPERVESLVVVDAGPEATDAGCRAIIEESLAAPEEWESLEAVVKWLRGRQPNAEEEVLRHQAVHLTSRQPGGRRTWKRDRQTLRQSFCPDLWKEWARLRCPVLIVRGRQSNILPHDMAVRMKEAIPRVRLAELEGGGHWIHLEFPGAFEAAVRWFLDNPPE